MLDETEQPRPRGTRQADSQIIGFRMPKPVAKAIKVEAARRKLPLNLLLAEMWQLYCESKRAG